MKKSIGFILSFLLVVLLIVSCTNLADLRNANNANLENLSLSEGTLSPVFNATKTSYTVTVPYATTSLTVTGTKSDANATMTPSDGKLSFTGLSVGTSDEQILKVVSQDGSVTKEYKVKVVRQHAEIEMLPVPAGSFQRDGTETNISKITKAYSLSKYQITRKAFRAIFDFDPSYDFEDELDAEERDMLPVQQVSWYDAIAFCNKLSIAEGFEPVYWVKSVDFASLTYDEIPRQRDSAWEELVCDWTANGYRLPTEAEWMWAAMGAPADGQNGGINTTGYSKAYAGSIEEGAAQEEIDDYSWHRSNSSSKTHPVGEKRANELGLYDMSGNVWEWCWDWYGAYPTGTQTDYRGAGSGSIRVSRGGGWLSNASTCAVAYRHAGNPCLQYYNDGFRILRPVQSP